MQHIAVSTFAEWRTAARTLLQQNVSPEAIVWETSSAQQSLGMFEEQPASDAQADPALRVPREFVALAREAACHRDNARWSLLYRILFRLTRGGERHLLAIASDPDVHTAMIMQKQVARDIHKMHAFVRFRKVQDEQSRDNYVAYHRPDHLIVEEAAPFFARRFASMLWAILTPDQSVYWDGTVLRYGPGLPASEAPQEDALEELWRSYYASVFNPARLKLKTMRAELPVRHWATLPEAQIIPALIQSAEERVNTMIKQQPTSASPFIPSQADLPVLREAVVGCQGCDLYRGGTRAVLSEGPVTAQVVLVGEVPGDEDERHGRPFSGPAGRLLDRALDEAGLDRSSLYITNAVKHFKFEMRGNRRIHQKPSGPEVSACRPWLERELELVQPKLIVCLGATAAGTLMGRTVTISRERGTWRPHRFASEGIMITMHPSAVLRMPSPELQEQAFQDLVKDLRLIHDKLQATEAA